MSDSKMEKQVDYSGEYKTNKILCFITFIFILIAGVLIINRGLSYGNTFSTSLLALKILLGLGIIGIILAFIMYIYEKSQKIDTSFKLIKSSHIFFLSLLLTFSMAVIRFTDYNVTVKYLYVLLPVIAALYFIFENYSREFFIMVGTSVFTSGIFWYVAYASDNAKQSVAIVIIGVLVLLSSLLKIMISEKNNGILKFLGKEYIVYNNDAKMAKITVIIMMLLMILQAFINLSSVLFYIPLLYIFVISIYYTVKKI